MPQFLELKIASTPDIYLDELQRDLKVEKGLYVDTATIWRALRRRGYTHKRVNMNSCLRVMFC